MKLGKAVLILFVFLRYSSAIAQNMSTKEYIEQFKFAAMQEMKVYKIPASITLGQGILESASGNSKLAKDCNNHFGIKCRKNWTGSHCLADDDAPNECFRGYTSAMESYRDHSLFLKENSRYATLFTYAVTDYKSWASGLKAAGYATNPAYANTLIGIIEKYRLGQYDSIVLFGDDYLPNNGSPQITNQRNGIETTTAGAGESVRDVANRTDLGQWQIYRYNDLKRGETLAPGEIVYLKPKKRKGDVAFHTVKEGETLRGISQEHGIKLKQLQKKNKLKPGVLVKPGEKLYLQEKRPQAPEILSGNNSKPAPTFRPKDTVFVKPNTTKPLHSDTINTNFHEVQTGETLLTLSKFYNVSIADLRRWNNLSSNTISAGQLLVLKPGTSFKPKDTSASINTEERVNRTLQYHVVLKGETLFGISKMYSVPLDSLKSWNKLNSNSLSIGQEILVKAPIKIQEQKEKQRFLNPIIYTVQPGDTLYSISRKYGLSLEELKKLNGLTTNQLSVGQSIKIK